MNKLNENIFHQYNKWKTGYERKENSFRMRLQNWIINHNFNESDFSISEDGKYVNCNTDLCLYDSHLIGGKFPFPFGEINGFFNCAECSDLISLEGAPQKVKTGFNCSQCYSLTSLVGAPKEVGGSFTCSHCLKLTSLEGAPEEVNGCFDCSECSKLTSLKGAPKEVGESFNCKHCYSLTSLKGLPTIIHTLYIDEDMKNKLPEYAKTFRIII